MWIGAALPLSSADFFVFAYNNKHTSLILISIKYAHSKLLEIVTLKYYIYCIVHIVLMCKIHTYVYKVYVPVQEFNIKE